VPRNVFKFVLFILLLASVAHPICESMDDWDASGTSNDTELMLLGVAVGLGLVFACYQLSEAHSFTLVCHSPLKPSNLIFSKHRSACDLFDLSRFESPPSQLRI
jgi:hypothetical protein